MRRGHPLHPALAAFPAVLWPTSVVWDVVGLVRPEPLWHQLAFWCLAAGLIAAAPAALLGLLDSWALPAEAAASRVANVHMALVLVAAALCAGSLYARRPVHEGFVAASSRAPGTLAIALAAAGALLVMGGAHFGGRLVFRYGVRVGPPD